MDVEQTTTQQALLQLVQATQMVATRTSLVRAGAPSHLGQLLPSALQLWSQDRQEGRGGKASRRQARDLLATHSRELSETTAKLAAGASFTEKAPTSCDFPRPSSSLDPCEVEAFGSHRAKGLTKTDIASLSADLDSAPAQGFRQNAAVMSEPETGAHPRAPEPFDGSGKVNEVQTAHERAPQRTASSGGLVRSDSFSSMPGSDDSAGEEAAAAASESVPEYLTIEEDENGDEDLLGGIEPHRVVSPPLSAAGQQLLLLLRVLRNLCATGTEATKAMAEVGVPQQVAHLVSDPLQGNTEGECPSFLLVWRRLVIALLCLCWRCTCAHVLTTLLWCARRQGAAQQGCCTASGKHVSE